VLEPHGFGAADPSFRFVCYSTVMGPVQTQSVVTRPVNVSEQAGCDFLPKFGDYGSATRRCLTPEPWFQLKSIGSLSPRLCQFRFVYCHPLGRCEVAHAAIKGAGAKPWRRSYIQRSCPRQRRLAVLPAPCTRASSSAPRSVPCQGKT